MLYFVHKTHPTGRTEYIGEGYLKKHEAHAARETEVSEHSTQVIRTTAEYTETADGTKWRIHLGQHDDTC